MKKNHIIHNTGVYPQHVYSAEETAERLKFGITPARLIELADAGYAPHYRIDNGPPLFGISEIKNWISENCLSKCEGVKLPDYVQIVVPAEECEKKAPNSIHNLPLRQLPKNGYEPGVYFLCKNDEVVYVGQSRQPGMRLNSHIQEAKKEFDSVYLYPVAIFDLNDLEAFFIDTLKPKYNFDCRGRLVLPTSDYDKNTALSRYKLGDFYELVG